MDYFLNPVITPNGHKRVASEAWRVKKKNLLGKAVTFCLPDACFKAQQPQKIKTNVPGGNILED